MDSKETYSAIKNYIHNELGITKGEIRKEILGAINETVKKQVDIVLNDKKLLSTIVEKELLRNLKKNSECNKYLIGTVSEVYRKIDSEIYKRVVNNLKIEYIEDTRGKDEE